MRISNLPFISKIKEKVVLAQLQSFLTDNSINEVFQSGFKALYSTELALLRVLSDIFLTTDSGKPMALVLLDLSAAFDSVEHNVLLSCLESCVGLRGMVLQWFCSYLSNRCFNVQLGRYSSSDIPLGCGVPQGSILGPVFFLCICPLCFVSLKNGVSFIYTQLYLPLQHNNKHSLKPLLDCLKELKLWLPSNFLQLNENKLGIILFGPNENVVFNCVLE